MGVCNTEIELMNRDELDLIKIERLQATLNRAENNVPFYRDLFSKNGIVPEKVRSVGDLANIPFTTRDDLVEHQPYEFFAVPLRDIARIHSSSGTTGTPVVVGYTRNDRKHWAELLARTLCAVGIDSTDIVQVSFAYGLFSGGFGLDMGAEYMGATVIPVSVGEVEQQIRIMRDYHTTCLFSTPSYAMQIGHVMKKKGIRSQELTLRKGLFGAEPWSEDVRSKIEQSLGIVAYDIYGISEIMGPGVAGECEYKDGLHVWEDHFIAEIIDPESGNVLGPGEKGELVLTTLTRESMPLIRYKTGDITSLLDKPCKCGRTHTRLSRITSRKTDLIIIRGVNIYIRDIEELLGKMFEIPVRYQLVVSRDDQGDNLEILIEVTGELFTDEMRSYRHKESTIKHVLAGRLSFEPTVRFVEPSHFPPQGEKYPRLVDKRNATD
ncbi:MAG: phenylacetate--CoA ligase [Candidatus Latescibacteria bacterium]|nr:phenylacetate--CoA ligase [Candidatus Latescibacterota bacterium]